MNPHPVSPGRISLGTGSGHAPGEARSQTGELEPSIAVDPRFSFRASLMDSLNTDKVGSIAEASQVQGI
jgi:hypothetical protein